MRGGSYYKVLIFRQAEDKGQTSVTTIRSRDICFGSASMASLNTYDFCHTCPQIAFFSQHMQLLKPKEYLLDSRNLLESCSCFKSKSTSCAGFQNADPWHNLGMYVPVGGCPLAEPRALQSSTKGARSHVKTRNSKV